MVASAHVQERIQSNMSGELGVPVPDQVADRGAGIVEVHNHVSGELGDPVRCRVGGGPQDADAAGCAGTG